MKYGPTIPTDNLLMLWDFANTNSYSGSGNYVNNLIPTAPTRLGSLNTLVTQTPANGPVYYNQNKGYVKFNGVDDVIHAPFLDSTVFKLNVKSFSVSMWIRPVSTGSDYIIFRNADETNYNYASLKYMQSTGAVFFTLNYSSPGTYDTYAFNYEHAKWNHIVITYTASGSYTNGELYCNGIKSTNKHGGNNIYDTYDLFKTPYFMIVGRGVRWLGNGYEYGYPYKGDFAYFSYHTRPLTDDEAYKMYHSTKSRFIL